MTPKVIYENEHLVVLDKPAGWLTHADGRTSVPTVAEWFVARYPAAARVGEPMKLSSGEIVDRPGIVHRLDRETSGVMTAAKDQLTYRRLRAAFAARQIKKSYRLIVHGLVKLGLVTIAVPIGWRRREPGRRVAHRGAAGSRREAVTDYQVLERFEDCTYLEAYPRTGRTHQLRAHFQSIQHPIIGDRLYGDVKKFTHLINRPMLHSYCLELPVSDPLQPSIFIAPLPLDFFSALAFFHES